MDEGVDRMTHQDIWDDSALVNSWNEALAEYKKYHSIHATGGVVDDLRSVSEQHAKPEPHLDQHAEFAPRPTAGEQGQEGEAVDGQGTSAHAATNGALTDNDSLDIDGNDDSAMNGGATHGAMGQRQGMEHASASFMPPPQALLGTVQDEGLKRLLMSWYYAGFYTGLYEGQQKHQDQQRQAK